ncbi:hypothetical protein K458DRAFT_318450 [Lentithecium fluviatile CBS 122367]|uniref:F-box domain-containing protein n=1 Tax=Lentithecium fluviatile CBS 122367 TaxID=1168545 RepID=A0A6G1IIC0_9PLEO|nr:hypothetical protein K458DRAFT_318450 [Lentithecium fluviatile CBS 122367]
MLSDTPPLLSLPTELCLQILELVLLQHPNAGFIRSEKSPTTQYHGLVIDDNYSSSSQLNILLTCRQFKHDFAALAFRSTTFLLKTPLPFNMLLRRLQNHQIASLRKLAFITSSERICALVHWVDYPFDAENIRLEELTIVFDSAEHWHFPSQYTRELVALLRRLQNVQVLRFVRNSAQFNGSFRTWYNRLVGLILKEDHHQRYDAPDAPNTEVTWWKWRYDYMDNSFELVAQPPKPILPEAEYIDFVAPMVRGLMNDMEVEEMAHG